MTIRSNDGRAAGTGREAMAAGAGRPADAPFLAVAIACLLAVALAAGAVWEPGLAGSAELPGSAPAAGPAVPATPVPMPAPATSPQPVFAVRLGALDGLAAIDGRLAWNGLRAGMDRATVAARLDGPLPAPEPHPAGWCGEYESRVSAAEGELILAFDGPGKTARLTSITLLLPAAEEVASPAEPTAPAPVFQTAAGEWIAVEPGVGLTFGDVCLG